MADLPTKLDRLLEILEIIAKEEQISVARLAKRLNTKISSIKLYLEYLEELGLIYRYHNGKANMVQITADVVAKVGDTMMAVVDGKAVVWRCPFRDICPYYDEGCTTADKCMFLSAFVPAIQDAITQQSEHEAHTSDTAQQE